HVSTYLDQVFPRLDNFSGVVMVSAASPFGVVALRQDQAVFGTVSVDNGPLLGTYFLASTPIAEIEPNNSSSQANALSSPSIIAASIRAAPYYFRFTGKQGYGVNALVSTPGLTSTLHTQVFLVGTDGTPVLGSNDDNGLFFQGNSVVQPQSDSFL